MSWRRRARVKRMAAAQVPVSVPGTIIEVNGLAGVHMTLEILGMGEDDVAEARRQAALCNVDHPLVQRVLWSFVDAFEIEPSGDDWSVAELATLFTALGMLPSWTTAVDVELAHLLAAESAGQGGGGRV